MRSKNLKIRKKFRNRCRRHRRSNDDNFKISSDGLLVFGILQGVPWEAPHPEIENVSRVLDCPQKLSMFRLVPSPKPISVVCPQLSLEKLSMSHPTGPRRSKMSRDTLGKDVTRPALPKAFWRDYFEMGFTDHHENSKKYLSSIGFSTYGKDLLK